MKLGKTFRWVLPWALAGGIGFQASAAGPSQNPKPVSGRKASEAVPPSNKLDTVAIRKNYLDGEFDIAIESIEDALKYGGPFSHQDSIFIFKHPGVMHTAKYETRGKGKRYLMELLNIEPTAKIMDMYASDMIYMIFKNIRDEFETRNPHRFSPSGGGPKPVAENPPPRKQGPGYAWVGWTLGAATVVGGGVLALHLMDEARSPKTRELVSHD